MVVFIGVITSDPVDPYQATYPKVTTATMKQSVTNDKWQSWIQQTYDRKPG